MVLDHEHGALEKCPNETHVQKIQELCIVLCIYVMYFVSENIPWITVVAVVVSTYLVNNGEPFSRIGDLLT